MIRKEVIVAMLVFGIVATYGHLIKNPELSEENVVDNVDTSLQYYLQPRHYNIGKTSYADHLVYAVENKISWNVPHDVKVPLIYPPPGQAYGAVLTYAEILVNQTSNIGTAVLKQGGVGQRQMTISLEAKNTLALNYIVKFYGVD